eukprot:9469000-Pyramimonas_sp.AAC.1
MRTMGSGRTRQGTWAPLPVITSGFVPGPPKARKRRRDQQAGRLGERMDGAPRGGMAVARKPL